MSYSLKTCEAYWIIKQIEEHESALYFLSDLLGNYYLVYQALLFEAAPGVSNVMVYEELMFF